jgi:hypothetical protein
LVGFEVFLDFEIEVEPVGSIVGEEGVHGNCGGFGGVGFTPQFSSHPETRLGEQWVWLAREEGGLIDVSGKVFKLSDMGTEFDFSEILFGFDFGKLYGFDLRCGLWDWLLYLC